MTEKDKLYAYIDCSDGFELYMTLEQAESVSHQGDCIHDVKALFEDLEIKSQFAVRTDKQLSDALKDYGAWDDEELKDRKENIFRLLWIAGGDIKESYYWDKKE